MNWAEPSTEKPSSRAISWPARKVTKPRGMMWKSSALTLTQPMYSSIVEGAITINGASRDELLAQREQIEALQEAHEMRILQGCELNIGVDGSIDYDPGFLAGLDWGVASVHSGFDLDAAEQTRRVVTAIENPAVNGVNQAPVNTQAGNPVAGARHERVIRRSVERICSLPVIGAIPRLP